MGEIEKKTQRMGWMIERLMAASPGSLVMIERSGERKDGSLYQATLVAPGGQTKAPCGTNAFDAVQNLHMHMMAVGHQHAKAAAEYLTAMGWVAKDATELMPSDGRDGRDR
jgi:hypothetical protein